MRCPRTTLTGRVKRCGRSSRSASLTPTTYTQTGTGRKFCKEMKKGSERKGKRKMRELKGRKCPDNLINLLQAILC